MKFVIVEDDYLQAEALQKELIDNFLGAHVYRIATEKDFRDYLMHFNDERPDVLIIDVMLRWTDPEPEMQPPPEDVIHNGPARAGFRCLRLLGAIPGLKAIQVILFTVLEKEDLEANLDELPASLNFRYMPKSSEFSSLIAEINKLTNYGGK